MIGLHIKLTVVMLFSATAVTVLNSCTDNDQTIVDGVVVDDDTGMNDSDFTPSDWSLATHSKEAEPNFEVVFSDTEVKRLDFVITEDRWESMLDNMNDLYGSFGSGGGGPRGDSDEDPVFVPAEVYFNGLEWYRVGLRFKGNSSLRSSWQSGILKLSFKLDFDEFEDDYPQIDNQRFYGFKKLSLKNNYDDTSMMREKVAGDVFRQAGLVGSHTAFYTLYVDFGEGPVYFGVYTLVEEVDNTVLDTQFSDDNGNLYKPDGYAASFSSGSFNEAEYVKKNNEEEADFSDVESLYSILHDESRLSDPGSWRTNLEMIFDTEVFLKYLAVNTVIQNWDTYGRMTHNYYLYNDPDKNKLTWIPWDNNEALQDGKMGGSANLDFSNINSTEWPLIGFLYQDEVYRAMYDSFVQELINEEFDTAKMQAKYASYAELLRQYANAEIAGYTFLRSNSDFQSGVDQLISHVAERNNTAINYLQK